jgi:hypothetical protein
MRRLRVSRAFGSLRHGRQTASSIRLASASLKVVAPATPTRGNRPFTSAAPVCTLTMATSSAASGIKLARSAREGDLNRKGGVTIISSAGASE